MNALINNNTSVIDLTADINASGFTWHVGYFAGTLDGHNHTISNLTTSDSIGQAAGMFTRSRGWVLGWVEPPAGSTVRPICVAPGAGAVTTGAV